MTKLFDLDKQIKVIKFKIWMERIFFIAVYALILNGLNVLNPFKHEDMSLSFIPDLYLNLLFDAPLIAFLSLLIVFLTFAAPFYFYNKINLLKIKLDYLIQEKCVMINESVLRKFNKEQIINAVSRYTLYSNIILLLGTLFIGISLYYGIKALYMNDISGYLMFSSPMNYSALIFVLIVILTPVLFSKSVINNFNKSEKKEFFDEINISI